MSMSVPAKSRYLNIDPYLCSRTRWDWIYERAFEIWLKGRPKTFDNRNIFSYEGASPNDAEPANSWAFKQARSEYDKVHPETREYLIEAGFGV